MLSARDLWRVNTAHVSSFVLISTLRGQPRTPPSGNNLGVLDYHLKQIRYCEATDTPLHRPLPHRVGVFPIQHEVDKLCLARCCTGQRFQTYPKDVSYTLLEL